MSDAPHPVENVESTEIVEKLSAERDRYRKLYLAALERCALLERGIIAGKKAEVFAPWAAVQAFARGTARRPAPASARFGCSTPKARVAEHAKDCNRC